MRKKAKREDESITTFLGPDANIEGTIEFKGSIRLDGKVQGKIKSKGGTVIVGEKAVINADLNVGTAIIMGRVNGGIEAADKIEISPPGYVEGNIQAPVISIDSGVKFNGNCSMTAGKVSGLEPAEASKTAPQGEEAKIQNFSKKPLTN